MQLLYRSATLILAISILTSCGGQKSAGLQEGAVAPDQVLFDNGMTFLEKSQYIKARLAFQTLINTYPESEHTPSAFLSIADSYYQEGGTENLLQAERQYKDFIIFYPTHEMADDAQMRVAAINVRLIRAPDRDPTYARKAEVELKTFLEDFPDSELAPTAEEFLREVQENLATGIQSVGNFYFQKKSYAASESRYTEVLEKYPNYSEADQTLYRLGVTLENVGRIEEASVYYSRVVAEYPFSEYADDAEQKLIMLERPVPPVDEVAAARHKANLPPKQGFSPLDPVKEVWSIFSGREDPYEVAKRRAEERRIQQQNSGSPIPSNGSNGTTNGNRDN